MRLKLLDDHFRNVLPMVVRLDKIELACFSDEFLHAVGALVVEDVIFGDNFCILDAL